MTLGSNVGVGTSPALNGATLQVQGNVFVSNALTAQNVFATTSANVGVLNTTSIVTSTGFLGIGTSAPSGTALYVPGNVYVSNTFTTTNVRVSLMNVSGMVTTTYFETNTTSIGIATGATGNALEVNGNVFVSDALTTTNVSVTGTTNVGTLNTGSIFTRTSFLGIGTTAASGTALYVPGNVYATQSAGASRVTIVSANVSAGANLLTFVTQQLGSNGGVTMSLTGNVYASNAITSVNVDATSANVTRVSNITTLAPRTTLIFPGGNAFVSNALTATNVFATTSVNATSINVTSFSTSNLGINQTTTATSTLSVQGNVYASKALVTTNVVATSMNVTGTLNVTSVVTRILVANALGWTNTNIFIANSITTTNIYTTNVTANVYGSLSINGPGGATLQINGNLASSNAFWSVPDVSATLSINYGEDITKRSPHLLPTQANAAVIQEWISSTCAAASQPTNGWWATSQQPVYGNVVVDAPGNGAYAGSVLLPDGRVVFVPYNAHKIGVFNPTTNEYSEIAPTGSGLGRYGGGVLLPNGNVFFGPATNNIGMFNPIASTFSNIFQVPSQLNVQTTLTPGVTLGPPETVYMSFYSGNGASYNYISNTLSNVSSGSQSTFNTLLPNGNIFSIYTSGYRLYNPFTGVNSQISLPASLVTTGGGGQIQTQSIVLDPSGNVVVIPRTGANTSIFVVTPDTTVSYKVISNLNATNQFSGAILLPTGNIIGVPRSSGNVIMIDSAAFTVSNVASIGAAGLALFMGGKLLPDGRVIFTPYNSTNVGVLQTFTPTSQEFCTSPYFNKF